VLSSPTANQFGNGTNTVDVTLSSNQTELSTWPSAATTVIHGAGLEPAYRDLLE